MNNGFMLSFFSDMWGEMINTLRNIPPEVEIWLYIGSAILMFAFLVKAVQVNLAAKDTKKMNIFWFFPIILLGLFIFMLSL